LHQPFCIKGVKIWNRYLNYDDEVGELESYKNILNLLLKVQFIASAC